MMHETRSVSLPDVLLIVVVVVIVVVEVTVEAIVTLVVSKSLFQKQFDCPFSIRSTTHGMDSIEY
jgi:hypothetical protein